MGLKAGWLALFIFVWIIGAFLGSTFEYQSSDTAQGQSYTTGTATFTKGSAVVTGGGTTWVAGMVDGNIKADTDGVWCKILTIDGVGQLTLYNPYPGTGGVGLAYTMAPSPGWAGVGGGGYDQSPTSTLQYLTNISNAVIKLPLLGGIPLPIPNPTYFKAIYKVLTWQWSFLDGYGMFYWIFCAPFVVMGVLSVILLVYGIITGNLTVG